VPVSTSAHESLGKMVIHAAWFTGHNGQKRMESRIVFARQMFHNLKTGL